MDKFDYNLVLMHMPNFQHIGDFLTVRNMMLGIAPEIRTLIASRIDGRIQLPGNALETINSLPTLIFSPAPLNLPDQFRGTRLISRETTKMKEYELLAGEKRYSGHSRSLQGHRQVQVRRKQSRSDRAKVDKHRAQTNQLSCVLGLG